MNHYIQIALIFWTLINALCFFANGAIEFGRKDFKAGAICSFISFLSLLTALLAVGHYIN